MSPSNSFTLRGRGASERLPWSGAPLQAEKSWLLEGPPAALQEIASALGPPLAELLSEDLLMFSFGNAVGYFELPHLGRFEVVSGKWDRDDFEGMLRDLMDTASALPFAASSAAALPYDRAVGNHTDVLYHAFVYLRYILSDGADRDERLQPALETIYREPHRLFERYTSSQPIEDATQVDGSSLTRLVSGRGQLTRVGKDVSARIPLAAALKDRLPRELEQRQVRSTYDTPENRFILSFLQLGMGVVEGMRRAVQDRAEPRSFKARVLADCTTMERQLLPLLRHSLWSEVGQMAHLPAASTVLQRRRGYRDCFRHFQRLRLTSRVPLDPERAWDLLEAKDIAQLYELWCFFTLVRATETLLGRPDAASGPEIGRTQVSIPWEYRVLWKDRAELLYNPRFSRSGTHERYSYSVPLRPDIALCVIQGPNQGLHLFDAKFRLDQAASLFLAAASDDETIKVAEEERRGTFKRGDLYKMHTYRDAIPGARTVWVLYPGDQRRFFSANDRDAVAGRDGVGAVPLVPLSDARELNELLSQLLKGDGVPPAV